MVGQAGRGKDSGGPDRPRATPDSSRSANTELAAVPSAPQVKKAFSQRRKVLRNSLQPLHSAGQVGAALAALGLSADARAQDLTLDDFVRLAWELQAQGGGGAGGGEDLGAGAEK